MIYIITIKTDMFDSVGVVFCLELYRKAAVLLMQMTKSHNLDRTLRF